MDRNFIWQLVPWRHARLLKLAADALLWAIAIPLAFYLRLEGGAWERFDAMLSAAAYLLPLAAGAGVALGLQRQSWTVVSQRDVRMVALAAVTTALVGFLVTHAFRDELQVPRSAPLLTGLVAFTLLCGARGGARWLREWSRARPGQGGRRVIIVGAGEAGTLLAREILRHPEMGIDPVAFLDDDPAKRVHRIMGIPVAGGLRDLPRVFRDLAADEALFSIPSANMSLRRDVFELAARARVPLRNVPAFYNILASSSHTEVRKALNGFVLDSKAKNVLIIGGGGYIGSALTRRLLDQGYTVRVLDLMIYGDDPILPFLDNPRFELVRGDFRQVNHVVSALQGIDTVVHLGGLVGDPACALDEELTIEINLMATKMIAEAAKGYGVSRFIFASTCSVYGASDEFLDEGSAFAPVSLYAKTKIASERILQQLTDETFSPTILRFATVYGFSGRTRFDLVVNLLTAKAVKDGTITVYGGDQWRPFIHVQDIAKAVHLVIEAPRSKVAGEVFNVGDEAQNHTLAEVAAMIQRIVHGSKITDSGLDSDRRNYRVKFQKLQDTLGFKPDWSLEAGILQVKESLERGDVGDYRDSLYSNVRFLTEEGLSKLVRREFEGVRDVLADDVALVSTRVTRR